MKRAVFTVCLLILIGSLNVIIVLDGGAAAAAPAQAPDLSQGQTLFVEKCTLCHGANGNGKGPNAATLNPPPADFNKPQFWRGDMTKKIQNAVTNGKGAMPAQQLKPDEVRAVVAYVTHTFKPSTTK